MRVLIGAADLFSAANWWMSKGGGGKRKRCGGCTQQPTEEDMPGSGKSIALGNIAQAMSSTSGLPHARRSHRFIFGIWSGLVIAVVAPTLLSFVVLGTLGDTVHPLVEAFAAAIP